MTSKERVNTTLDRREPDRVPFGEWGVDHDMVEALLGRPALWRNRKETTLALWAGERDRLVEAWKEEIVELVHAVDYDLVPTFLVPAAGIAPQDVRQVSDDTWEAPDGRVWKYSSANDDIRLVKGPEAFQPPASPEEYLERFEAHFEDSPFRLEKSPDGHYRFRLLDRSVMELVEHTVRELGGERFIFARGLGTGFEMPFFGSMEDFFITMAMKPEIVKAASSAWTDFHVFLSDLMIDAGVDAVMPGSDLSDSNGPMASPDSIREIFLPDMKRLADHVKSRGARVMSHNCGNNIRIMDVLIEAGYEAWQSIQAVLPDLDMKRLKEDFGDEITLWGGINIETLHDGAPEENRRDVLYALEHAAPGGGFILGTSNSVSFGSKPGNYRAAVQAWKEFRDYPIAVS